MKVIVFANQQGGTGKTTTARLLAKAVNCLSDDLAQRPCNQCAHCQAVNQGRFLDLIEIDAASNTSVEDVRDVRDKINFSPNLGRYKVYIIDEVHMLSTAAFNALLKTLEEPPPHAIFILATTEGHKIPATVLSAGYGMGLWVGSYHLGGQEVRWLAHGGGGFGFRCQMKWLPELGYGVVVLTNAQDHDNVNENLAEDVLLKVVELLTGKKDLGPSEWLARHTPSVTADATSVPIELAGRYCGTNDDMSFLVKDGTFGYASATTFVPITPISRYEYATQRYLCRFVRDAGGKAVSVVRPYDGTVWTLGSPADEKKGPEKKEWASFVGSYVRKRFGVGERFYNVSLRNGWLHFQGDGQDFRLSEHLPGLFFTPDGEAVDLRGPVLTFRNIPLYRTCS